MNNLPTLRFPVNDQAFNKDVVGEPLQTGYRDKIGTLQNVVDHVKQGHAIAAGLFGGRRRGKANVIGSQMVLLDVDNEKLKLDEQGNQIFLPSGKKATEYDPQLTVEKALEHPFIQQYCALIYTTASHKPDHHKLRLAFLLPHFETDVAVYEAMVRKVMAVLPHDRMCKDASRVFFGNSNAEIPLFNPHVTLPVEWREEAAQAVLLEKAKREQDRVIADRKRAAYQLQVDRGEITQQDTDANVLSALYACPPRSPGSGNYPEAIRILMALVSHFGESEAERIAEAWSPSIKGDTWQIARKIRSFKGNLRVGVGTLFYIAKQNGWRFPTVTRQTWTEKEPVLTREEWEKKHHHSFDGLTGFLPWFKAQYEKWKKTPWGLGEKQLQSLPFVRQRQPQYYQPGERLQMWQKFIAQGYRHILDTSGTGAGKSHDAGLLTPETLGAKKLFYVSEEHRNPSVQTLIEGWVDCPPRHNGFFRDEHDRLRRQGKEGEGYVVAPNCGRTLTGSALREKQIGGADETSLLCQTCSYLENCRRGKDFGYIRQRSEALVAPKTRIHPLSLPSVFDADGNIDHDYAEEVLIHDEAGAMLKVHRAFSVGVFDLQRTIADLMVAAPAQFQAIQDMLARLLRYLRGEVEQTRKYGWDCRQTVDILMQEGLIVDVEAVRQALTIDLRERLSTTDKYGVSLADLPSGMRKNFSDSDRTVAEKIRAEVALQWLPDVLDILTGVTGGALQINAGKLLVTIADYRYREVAQHAKANIYLDATITREEMAWRIGCDADEIAVIQQEVQQGGAEVAVTQVTGLGRLGISGRSAFLQQRVDAVVNHLCKTLSGQTAVIDFKRYNFSGDGRWAWYRDSRGINDLQDVLNLILVGTPCPNLAAMEAEYICITGRVPKPGTVSKRFDVQIPGKENDSLTAKFTCEVSADPEFADFCHQRIVSSIVQAVGRLRADRRPGEKLRVYFLGDYPLPMPVMLTPASKITPEAMDKVERVIQAITDTRKEIAQRGVEETRRLVSRLSGIAIASVLRYWERSTLLLETINSKVDHLTAPPAESSDAHIIGTVYLPLLAEEDPPAQLEGLWNVFQAYGKQIFQQAWSLLSATASIQLQTGLLWALPEAEFKQLSAIA